MGGSHDVPAPKAVGWYSYVLHRPCKLQETEYLLKSAVYRGEQFVRVEYGHEVVGWDYPYLTETATQELEEYGLLRRIGKGGELVQSCLDDPINAMKALESADRCCNGESFVREYDAPAAKEIDADETEEFLRGVVEKQHKLERAEWKGKLSGWYNLAMDRVTKEEVEMHHGIKSVRPVQKIVAFGSVKRKEEIKTYVVGLVRSGNVDCAEEFLEAKIRNPDIIRRYVRGGMVLGWGNLEMNEENREEVESHRGIEDVEVMGDIHNMRDADGIPKCLYRDVELYNAMASMGSDVKKTEDFLVSRVQKPDEMRRHEWGQTVTGWWNLSIDEIGKTEVKTHKGIDNLELMRHIKWFKNPGRRARRSHDTRDYLVLMKEGFDEVKMAEFLMSKARDEKSVWPRTGEGKVMAWDVKLESAALKDVERHEGVCSVRLDAKIVPF